MSDTTCQMCGDERDEITGLLCYRCRSSMQEREMQELRAENERLQKAFESVSEVSAERGVVLSQVFAVMMAWEQEESSDELSDQ